MKKGYEAKTPPRKSESQLSSPKKSPTKKSNPNSPFGTPKRFSSLSLSSENLPDLDFILDLKESVKNFFEEINALPITKIADYLSKLERKNAGKRTRIFEQENLETLLKKINESDEIELCISDLDKILNSLAGLGYKREHLEALDQRKLSLIANQKIKDCDPRNFANILNGFARLGFDKGELEIEEESIVGNINQKIFSFSTHDILTSLHAFAHLGYSESDQVKQGSRKLISCLSNFSARKPIEEFNQREISSLVHSLARMEMFEELFSAEFHERINSALKPDLIETLTPESAHSLLQAQDICDALHREEFLPNRTKEKIKKLYPDRLPTISDLHVLIGRFLPDHQKEHLLNNGKNSTRITDLCYVVGNKIFFIEVDGPSHFYAKENSAGEFTYHKNSATKQRDKVSQAIIAEIALNYPNQEFHYVTFPFYEIDGLNVTGVANLIDSALKNSQKIEPAKAIELEALEAEEFEAYEGEDYNEIYIPDSEDLSPIKMSDIFLKEISTTSASELEDQKEPEKKQSFEAKKSSKRKIKKARREETEKVADLRKAPAAASEAEKTEKQIEFMFTRNSAKGFAERFVNIAQTPKIFERIIAQNRLSFLKTFITAGIDVNATLPNSLSPIAFAAAQKPVNIEIINSLIAAGVEISAELFGGPERVSNLLIEALKKDPACIEAACALIKLDEVGVLKNALKLAAKLNSLELVNAIIEKPKFDPETPEQAQEIIDAINRNLGNLDETGIEIFDKLIARTEDLGNINFSKPQLFRVLLSASKESVLKLARNHNIAKTSFANDFTPMQIAASRGQADVIEALIASGASVHAKTKGIGMTALHFAAFNGDVDSVNVLLAGKSDANHCLRDGSINPLKTAVFKNNIDAANILIDVTKINAAFRKGLLLELTEYEGTQDTMKLLIDRWFSQNQEVLNEALIEAVSCQNLGAVEILIRSGANVNYFEEKSNAAPLHVAVQNGSLDIARTLLEAGADSNILDSNDITPLHLAAYENNLEMAKLLVKHEGNLIALSVDNQTSLHLAVEKNNPKMVKFLSSMWRKKGFNLDLSVKNPKGDAKKDLNPALYRAIELLENKKDDLEEMGKTFQIVNILLDSGANIDASSLNKTNALTLAAFYNYTPCVKLLIERGANIYLETPYGNPFNAAKDSPVGRESFEVLMAEHNRRKVIHEQRIAEEEKVEKYAKDAGAKDAEVDHVPAKDQELADTLLESLVSSVRPESPSNTTANRDKKANNLKSSRISLGL